MANIPKLLNKIVKKDDGVQIQFVTAWTRTMPHLTLSILLTYQIARMVYVDKDALSALIWFGCIYLLLISYYFVLGIPRSLLLNFETRTYKSAMGFGSLSRRRQGSLDEIRAVYFSAHNDTYRIGLSFGKTKDNPQVIMLALPRCDLTMFYKRDAVPMWDYAKQLADRIGVPCEALNWSVPNNGVIEPPPDGLPVH